jgi:hypothetical protein
MGDEKIAALFRNESYGFSVLRQFGLSPTEESAHRLFKGWDMN